MLVTFEEAYRGWLDDYFRMHHRNRLQGTHQRYTGRIRPFLENVWWPEFRSFDDLHPWYEAAGGEVGYGYVDLAYLRPPFRIGFDLGGSRSTAQINQLIADFWIVMPFPLEDIRENPARCRQLLSKLFGRLYREPSPTPALSPLEREIVRIAAKSTQPIRPSDILNALHVSDKTARLALKLLVDKRLLKQGEGGAKRTRSYVPAMEAQKLLYIVG